MGFWKLFCIGLACAGGVLYVEHFTEKYTPPAQWELQANPLWFEIHWFDYRARRHYALKNRRLPYKEAAELISYLKDHNIRPSNLPGHDVERIPWEDWR